MNDEISISKIVNRIKHEKKSLLLIIGLSIFLSLSYALTKEEVFKSTAHLIPPTNKYTQPLNIFLDDGYRLTQEAITPSKVYRTFVLNLQSRKYQRKYFFENKLYEFFDESSPEKSFEDNFHNQIIFKLDSKITSRDFRAQQFLSVSFFNPDPNLAAEWLNDYITMVDKETSQDYADGINILIQNTKNTFKSTITSKKNISKQITADRIIQLEEALRIAKELQIIDRSNKGSNQQSVFLTENENIQSKDPLYLAGTKAIQAEISALKTRKDEESFIVGLRQLQQKVKSLDSITVDVNNVRAAQIDQKALPPEVRHSPKRKLIVFVGTFFGFVLAFFYLLFSFIFRKEQ